MKRAWNNLTLVLLILIMTIFTSSLVIGVDISANYDVIGDNTKVVYEIYSEETVYNYFIPIPKDAKLFDIVFLKEKWNYEFIVSDDNKYILFEEFNGKVNINFESDSFIDDGVDTYFITDFKDFDFKEIKIFITLPEDAKLKYKSTDTKSSFIPTTGKISTDGQRISINWTGNDFINNNAILVIYRTPNAFDFNFGIIALFIAIIIFSYILFKKTKKLDNYYHKATTNLYEDEREIVDVLFKQDDKEMWQKELASKTNLSKVRLSRKLRNLESKGVIEKIPYGNTNKIKLKDI